MPYFRVDLSCKRCDIYDMNYSLHIHTDRFVNDRFGYYSKLDPLYQHFLDKKQRQQQQKRAILLQSCS